MKTSTVFIHCCLSFLLGELILFHPASCFSAEPEDGEKRRRLPLTSRSEFQTLFKQRRQEHLSAVKMLLSKDRYEHRYQMVDTVFRKMFEVLEEAKAKLESSGYIPGVDVDLPVTQHALESLSSVLENCAFLGDIVLHLPDVSRRVLNTTNKWMITTNWCISFTNSTGLLDRLTHKMLNLVAQELDLIPRSENYFNPYSEEYKMAQRAKGRPPAQGPSQKSAPTPKPKKKVAKGPRLSKKMEL